MRRLISFLLLATAAAGPLAAQVRDPQDQRAPRGDRNDPQREDRGNRPAVQPAPATQAQGRQAPSQAAPARPAPGQLGQANGLDPRRDNSPNAGRFAQRPGNGTNNGPANRPGVGGNGAFDPGRGNGANGGFANRPGNGPNGQFDPRFGNGPNNGYAGRPNIGPNGGYAGRPNDLNGRAPGYQGRDGWSSQWRDDRRYDWQGYRSANRNLFRAPRYYGPRGYDYTRWSRGYRVQPFFYGQNYWISDPWRYRLPPVDGYYRWVRYYDDVALIDIRSGLIEDIIYSFFWR